MYNCVRTGPFREGEWELAPLPAGEPPEPGPRCLARAFHGIPPDIAAVQEVLKTPVTNFNNFEYMLRVQLHDHVHCLIDGTMCSYDAASAPEFFLHHGFIDKIWDDWQKKGENYKNEYFPSNVPQHLPGTKVLPKEVVDLSSQPGGVRAEYQLNPSAAGGKYRISYSSFRKFRQPRNNVNTALGKAEV